MDKVMYVLGYLNETHGFDLVFPASVLVYREEDTQVQIVVDRGIKGCPKYTIPNAVIDEWVEDHSSDPIEVEIDEPEDLTVLPGVGPKLAKALNTAGVYGVFDIMHGNSEYLLAIPGMSDMKLKQILEHITEEERAEND